MRRDLLRWYDANQRGLPWRRTTDPYAILVSEVMCQQTRVDVVIPYYETWMNRWPTVETLANADEEAVMAQWSGLGYYRRARNLHVAAKQIATHGWPQDLKELPGVGPYIAGALASIAFGIPRVAIDGNVQRVLSRLGDIQADVTKAEGRNAIQAMAEELLAPERTGDWTQALMELGATTCTPTSPRCSVCPVSIHCQTEAPESVPVKAAKRPPVPETMHFAVVQDGGRVLLVRRPEGGLLGGTWALPGGDAGTPLEDHVAQQAGLNVRLDEEHGEATHVFSHRHWTMQVHTAEVLDGALGEGARWVAANGLHQVGWSTAMRKAFDAAPRVLPQAH